VTVCALGAPASAAAQGIDETCLLALTKFDPATINIAFPDDSAQYFSANYVPGARVRITGRFPHARYMSFNVYDPLLRPVDGLTDVNIKPDAGSTNPFLPRADRDAEQRSYTVFIQTGAAPKVRAPNTLYTGDTNAAGLFIYRIYVPDRGASETGDVGLPTATLEPPGATATPDPSPCTNFSKPGITGVNELLASLSPAAEPPVNGGTNPPTWRKFVNVLSSVAVNALGTPAPAGLDLDELGGSGGFLSNRDNAYVSAPLNRNFGPISVTRVRVPSFADTRAGAAKMPSGQQVRYWSMCQNDPLTQRFIGCVNDDRAVKTSGGYATFVVSTPAKRPPTATAKCGVNWLPWGPNTRGVLIYRHMLPAESFTASVQTAKVDHEAATMGEYLPASSYYKDAATYSHAVGCPRPARAAKRKRPRLRRPS
jgi:hypothetical protein